MYQKKKDEKGKIYINQSWKLCKENSNLCTLVAMAYKTENSFVPNDPLFRKNPPNDHSRYAMHLMFHS